MHFKQHLVNQIAALTTLVSAILFAAYILFKMYSNTNLMNTTNEVIKEVTTIVPSDFIMNKNVLQVEPLSDFVVL